MSIEIVLLILRIVIAVVLYAFVGTMFLFLWQDLRTTRNQTPDRNQPSARLVLVQSQQVPLEVGKSFVIQASATLGRGSNNTIVIPDSFVSIEHALITWQRGQWWLEDRHSRNGITLNNLPVTEAVVLSSGDEIGIGRITLRIELDPLS
jgi:pSer/pThr/pTyr-binding forkhead associated (FHA) protein